MRRGRCRVDPDPHGDMGPRRSLCLAGAASPCLVRAAGRRFRVCRAGTDTRHAADRRDGHRIRLTGALKRNGTLAVFLLRKVPAPFLLANIVVGASTVRYRDFVIGTILGMGAMIIMLAGFGYQLTMALRSPSASTVLIAAMFVAIPLSLALLINRALRGA